MKVAIIPARSGSKRIKNKNIREFCGCPMIGRAILNAKKSGLFDRIIISTDSIEIKAVAHSFGGEVPFLRPKNLADDFTSTISVVRHGIQWFLEQGVKLSAVCCIYPATPFLKPEDLNLGLKYLKEKKVDFTYAITSFPHPIQRAMEIDDDGILIMNDPNMSNIRSQDLVEFYHDAGQFYWANFETWLEKRTILDCKNAGVILPKFRAIDIDTLDDWVLAERIFQASSADGWTN